MNAAVPITTDNAAVAQALREMAVLLDAQGDNPYRVAAYRRAADMVARLTPDEMLALGKYYEKMSLPREEAKDPQLAAMGRYLYHNGNKFSGVPACVSCHGTNAVGAANLPRLATQFSGYIHTQLKSFNKRDRTNDNVVMHVVAEKMTELEMAAVAEYVSSK